jgi:hypothetical protein
MKCLSSNTGILALKMSARVSSSVSVLFCVAGGLATVLFPVVGPYQLSERFIIKFEW